LGAGIFAPAPAPAGTTIITANVKAIFMAEILLIIMIPSFRQASFQKLNSLWQLPREFSTHSILFLTDHLFQEPASTCRPVSEKALGIAFTGRGAYT
jgi:hypothetical protein